MDLINYLILGLFIFFVISLVIGLIKLLWPVLLILGAYIGYKYYQEKKRLENQFTYTAQENTVNQQDIFDADYEVKKEEE